VDTHVFNFGNQRSAKLNLIAVAELKVNSQIQLSNKLTLSLSAVNDNHRSYSCVFSHIKSLDNTSMLIFAGTYQGSWLSLVLSIYRQHYVLPQQS
jgi:hypothetical protein